LSPISATKMTAKLRSNAASTHNSSVGGYQPRGSKNASGQQPTWSVRPKVSPTGEFHRSEQPGRAAVANAASMSIARFGLLPFAALTLRTMTAAAQPIGIGIPFPATCLGVSRIVLGYPKNRHRRGDSSGEANHTGEFGNVWLERDDDKGHF